MLLPTKGISPSRCILTLAAEAYLLLDKPATPEALWRMFNRARTDREDQEEVTFDWFSYAITALYVLGRIQSTSLGQIERINSARQS